MTLQLLTTCGPARAIGAMSVWIQTVSFELNDLCPGYCACCFKSTPPRPNLEIIVIVKGHIKSQDAKNAPFLAIYQVFLY